MNQNIKQYISIVNQQIEGISFQKNPASLYEPISYLLSLGGKRLRPLLAILSYKLFRDDYKKIVEPTLALEIFHNFTLMHDDIMDKAPMRRGQQTVHQKWNTNTAILSGDTMYTLAFELLNKSPENILPQVLQTFIKSAYEVCEGQQLDMDFEVKDSVNETEYLEMIQKKTAVLLGYSLQLGAILANQDHAIQKKLYDLGIAAGMGFQLKDDLLDVFGETEKVGKQKAGDILSNKKTFLLIKAFELSRNGQKEKLNYWTSAEHFDPAEKINSVIDVYNELDIKELATKKVESLFETSFQILEGLEADQKAKDELAQFLQYLIERES
ncbi:MAG: polyprenyl synthetase family protein [Bacteroidota bacterium]